MIINKIDKIIKSRLCVYKNEFNNSLNLHKTINTISTLSIKKAIFNRIFSDVFLLSLIININRMFTLIINNNIKNIIIKIVISTIKLIIKIKTLNITIKATRIKTTINTIKIKIDFQTLTHCNCR